MRLEVVGLAFFMAATVQANAATSKSTKVPPTPLSYNCDVKSLFQELLVTYTENKATSQFESKAEYERRIGTQITAKLAGKLRNLTCELASEALFSKLRYEPETKTVNFYLESKKPLFRDQQDEVEHLVKINWIGLYWKMPTGESLEVPMSAKDAEAEWKDLSLAVIGDIASPYLVYDETIYPRRVDRPAYKHEYWYVVMNPTKLVLWNKRTGKTIREWRRISCNSVAYAWVKC